MITSTGNAQVRELVKLMKKSRERDRQNVFLVEGPRMTGELLDDREWQKQIQKVYFSESFTKKSGNLAEAFVRQCRTEILSDSVFEYVSDTKTPQGILAVVERRTYSRDDILRDLSGQGRAPFVIVLDNLQDPGNMGTVFRTAEAAGATGILMSSDCVDVYNPKVVQATMGSIARVKVEYGDLLGLVESLPADVPVYGTLLDGDNIYQQTLENRGLIVMGNEGKGISPDLAKKVNHKLLIPNFPEGRATADSLNVAIATAITCSEFRRNF